MRYKIITFFLTLGTPLYAAQLFDLKDYPTNILSTFINQPASKKSSDFFLKEINRYTDHNLVTHIRMQEYFRGYRVKNAQAVIHVPAKMAIKETLLALLTQSSQQQSMNGELYQQLNLDLDKTPQFIFEKNQIKKVTNKIIENYLSHQTQRNQMKVKNYQTEMIVFIDNHQTAHWAYEIRFDVPAYAEGVLPAKFVYVVDAVTFQIYQSSNDIKTLKRQEQVQGGGLGGNLKMGKLTYDGAAENLPSYSVTRVDDLCYLQNDETIVKKVVTNEVMSYPCFAPDEAHGDVYWSGSFDEINDGYSPANDAMYAAQVIKKLYKTWYNVPALINPDGSEMILRMNVHFPKLDNAFWDGSEMTFGDGKEFYPLTGLGISAHEVSHGFTQQHSNLDYWGQSGGINESFSDMAAQTAEYFSGGKSSWLIGGEILRMEGEALRYMDRPSKDCYGKAPGTFCSIDSADEYYEGLDVHFTSGVYNRAFYLLSTTPGWNQRKAFAVMLHANASYWLSYTQYADGAA
ncbi:MAG: M4 family metallopeptidase, partial [Legionella longbeachae]|nr:M4 family metallopeptidase [Legionella longbeachae]